MTDNLLTLTELAEALRCHPDTIRRAVASGELRAMYVARHPRFHPDDVDAYLRRPLAAS